MSVYVDKSAHRFGRMKMCHMIADTPEELRAMVVKIGVDPKWFQADSSMPHFDIAKSKRALAIEAGAIELGHTEYVAAMQRIRASWPVSNKQWTLPWTLRDQLDQIARLEETLAQSQTLCTVAEFMTARAKSNEALGNFWRSGGRELAEDGMKWRAHKEKLEEMQKLKAIAVAARAKEEKDVG